MLCKNFSYTEVCSFYENPKPHLEVPESKTQGRDKKRRGEVKEPGVIHMSEEAIFASGSFSPRGPN